jgi:Adenine-specific DNA methylase containing a Zn-ribbon
VTGDGADSPTVGDDYPIERGFPVARVNDLVNRETRARLHYRPLSVLHKWWARQFGTLFRAISLYTFSKDPEAVTVHGSGGEGAPADGDGTAAWDDDRLAAAVDAVELSSPETLWELYAEDVRVDDVNVLDPFVGAGTTLAAASRFGASVTGVDLNPLATFLTERTLTAHRVDTAALESAFETVREAVATELRSHYRTACPEDDDHTADVVYGLWVRCLDCSACGEQVRLFRDYRVASGRYADRDRDVVYCPDCDNVFTTDDYETETVCPSCTGSFTPAVGPVANGNYGCPACGLQYPIVDAIAEGQSYDDFLYAVEYYCPECEDAGADRPTYKGYRAATVADRDRFDAAAAALAATPDLSTYLPETEIPEGAVTTSSRINGNDLFAHGFQRWADLFNPRQRYCLATLLEAIDDLDDPDARAYLLTAFTDSLAFQSRLSVYNPNGGKVESVFRRNSFTPRVEYAENNVWGTRAGRGTFTNTFQKVRDAVEYASAPTERHLVDDEMVETEPFDHPVGGGDVRQGDARAVDTDDTYDVVLTDPPYYGNAIYSELSEFYYVWLRLVLADEHSAFEPPHTPRDGEIVSNPATDTDDEGFETALGAAFGRVRDVLADDGVSVFTYRHGGPSEWAALVDGLVEAGLVPTATYPVSSNAPFGDDDAEFTVVVVARPTPESEPEPEPISWATLRRRLYATAGEARAAATDGQTLSEGDAAVVALGRCLRVYAPHHGAVRRDGAVLDTETVLRELFDTLDGDVSVTDVYLTLLSMDDPTAADVRRLCRGTTVDPSDLEACGLVDRSDGAVVADWDTPARRDYVASVAAADRTPLDTVHLARARDGNPDHPTPDATGAVLDVAAELVEITGDEGYERPFRR